MERETVARDADPTQQGGYRLLRSQRRRMRFQYSYGFSTFFTSPRLRLSDSHIFQPQRGAVLDALEVVEALAHHSRAGFSVVSGPAAETTNHPGSKG